MSRTWTTGIVRIEFPPSRAHARTSSETCSRGRLFARSGNNRARLRLSVALQQV